MAKLEFIFDFASPNAYFTYKVLPGLLERTGAELDIQPVLLGGLFKITGNQAPFVAFSGVKGKMDYELLETQRFIDKHRLDKFWMNEHFPLNTVSVMRGLVAARELGCAEQYIEVVLSATWEQNLKMDDPEVITSTRSARGSSESSSPTSGGGLGSSIRDLISMRVAAMTRNSPARSMSIRWLPVVVTAPPATRCVPVARFERGRERLRAA